MTSKAQIPEGWRRVRLGDVANIAFSGVDKRTVEGELPIELCNYTDVFYNRRIHPEMEFMAATATQVECDRYALRKGDVLFTKDSETADEIGIPSYVAEDMAKVLCGYHLGLARSKTNVVNGAFLARMLASRECAFEFARMANGITRFGLTLDATRNLPILLPPLSEQRAIAAVLDSIDEAIEGTEAVIAATERLRNALLHELLTRGVPGWHTEWKDAPGVGTIPVDWEVVKLGDVAEVVTGNTPPREITKYYGGNVPWVKPSDLGPGRLVNSSEEYLTEAGVAVSRQVSENAVLVSCIGTIGEVAVSKVPLCFNQQINALIPYYEVVLPSFLCWACSHKANHLRSIAAKTAVPILNKVAFSAVRIALPPLSEQIAIAAVLDGVDDAIEYNKSARDKIIAMKASASDALLTGRVRVPHWKMLV